MTNQMQRLISRVDGMRPEVPPVSILEPSEPKTRSTAPALTSGGRRRRQREARAKAGVLSGRAPRAIELLALAEASDMHGELLAAGLL
jgi:hypothetical protein